MADLTATVVDAIVFILRARENDDVDPAEVTLEARLAEDLRLDSLELAELSENLADALGRDPYDEGLAPVTVGEIIAFYEG